MKTTNTPERFPKLPIISSIFYGDYTTFTGPGQTGIPPSKKVCTIYPESEAPAAPKLFTLPSVHFQNKNSVLHHEIPFDTDVFWIFRPSIHQIQILTVCFYCIDTCFYILWHSILLNWCCRKSVILPNPLLPFVVSCDRAANKKDKSFPIAIRLGALDISTYPQKRTGHPKVSGRETLCNYGASSMRP